MNDPLYNHPAWKVGRAGDSVDVDHVISEIVKSNYASKSHDQAIATESEDEIKNSPLPSKCLIQPEIDNPAATKCSLETAVDRENWPRTNDGEENSVYDEKTVAPRHTQAGGHEIRLYSPKSKVVNEMDVQVKEKEDEEKDPSFKRDKDPDDCSEEEISQSHKGEKKLDMLIDYLDNGTDCEVMSCDPDCTECRTVHPDPTPLELMMFLHALSYKVCPLNNSNIRAFSLAHLYTCGAERYIHVGQKDTHEGAESYLWGRKEGLPWQIIIMASLLSINFDMASF